MVFVQQKVRLLILPCLIHRLLVIGVADIVPLTGGIELGIVFVVLWVLQVFE